MSCYELWTLIDNRDYIETNCYQHQMSYALEAEFDVRYVPMDRLEMLAQAPADAHVLSRLKLRTAFNSLPRLRSVLAGRKVIVYDQDPWESFMIGGAYSGAYQRIAEALNVSTFLNISHWWRDRVIECGLPSTFVQVWTLDRYCRGGAFKQPIPWAHRKYDAVFCGTMYPRRKEFFDRLKALGLEVQVLPAGRDYREYLDDIAHAKVAIRSENVSWTIDVAGQARTITSANALWKRDIETAAQGCFSMRDLDDEAKEWNVSSIPTIIPFISPEDAVRNFKYVMSMSAEGADQLVKEGCDYIRNAPGWRQMCDVVRGILEAK